MFSPDKHKKVDHPHTRKCLLFNEADVGSSSVVPYMKHARPSDVTAARKAPCRCNHICEEVALCGQVHNILVTLSVLQYLIALC